MHTSLSHDGKLSLAQLKSFLQERSYQFICVTDHSPDVSPEQWEMFKQECRRLTDSDFIIVPSIEYTCTDRIDIMGIGLETITNETDPKTVVEHIHKNNGLAILCHPTKLDYTFERDWVQHLDGVELWNVGYDGKFLPQRNSIQVYRRLRRWKRDMLAFFGLDLHGPSGFYDLSLWIDSEDYHPDRVVPALKAGRYICSSRFLSILSQPPLTTGSVFVISVFRTVLNIVRSLRDLVIGE
jgi:histidinol phosphatase-like PHP family hydrolase